MKWTVSKQISLMSERSRYRYHVVLMYKKKPRVISQLFLYC